MNRLSLGLRRHRGGRRSLCLLLGLLLIGDFVLLPAYGQESYELEQPSPVWLRGLLDVRIARGGRASSWADKGLGKARYGGRTTTDGLERKTRLALSQLAIEIGGTLPWGIIPHAHLSWETDIPDDERPLLIEAFLRREWGRWEKGWGLQAGVMNLPFSLEHSGPARTPQYTLTPSALNTWLWEEGRVVGLEGEWWQTIRENVRLSLLFGSGFGPDQIGRLLSVRGWVLSDGLSGVNSDLPLPNKPDKLSVFDEKDYRPSIYFWLTLSDAHERGELRLGYFDSLGDQNTTGVWETRFGTIGVILRPLAHVEFLAQYLEGTTHVRGMACDVGYSAFYTLLSFRYRGHRVSVRYDDFRVTDLDSAPFYREHGDGVTLAYLFEFGLHHRVGFEYVFLHSRRPMLSRSDPSDAGWQLSYRFRY
jgi:hypothetical protein